MEAWEILARTERRTLNLLSQILLPFAEESGNDTVIDRARNAVACRVSDNRVIEAQAERIRFLQNRNALLSAQVEHATCEMNDVAHEMEEAAKLLDDYRLVNEDQEKQIADLNRRLALVTPEHTE